MEQIFSEAEVILGVDTHLDVHVGVVIDQVGRVQGTHSIPPRVRLVAAPMIADDPHWSAIHDNKSTFN